MGKIAFVFPGQGAQYVGMAKDFYEARPESREVFNKASAICQLDMQKLCFEENELLNETEYTQVAMLTACISILKVVDSYGITADVTAGLSLGEYCALVYNHTLDFKSALSLVRKRGILMANAVPNGEGAMAAILGSKAEQIQKVCQEVSIEAGKPVEIANYNCPGQIVISGAKESVIQAQERLTEAGARRVVPLRVSGPFHSSLLYGAGEKLEKELKKISVYPMQIPYVSNVNASMIHDENIVKELLKQQVFSSVKWQHSVEQMIENGVDTFIEIGPGHTLSHFIKKINHSVRAINIEKLEDLEQLEDLKIQIEQVG